MKPLSRRTFLAASSLALLTACAPVVAEVPPPASEAPEPWSTLDAREFAAALQRPGTVVLDVRTPAEFADGHLEDALNIDVSASDFAARIGGLDPSASYAVYCRSGNRSAVAMSAMRSAGFTDVYHLGGGIGAWQSAGLPVTTP